MTRALFCKVQMFFVDRQPVVSSANGGRSTWRQSNTQLCLEISDHFAQPELLAVHRDICPLLI